MLLEAVGTGGPGVRVTGANVVQIAVPFIWLGMVLAISFLETPLKFRAPGITVPLGLGIGRLVFRALAVVELALAGRPAGGRDHRRAVPGGGLRHLGPAPTRRGGGGRRLAPAAHLSR